MSYSRAESIRFIENLGFKTTNIFEKYDDFKKLEKAIEKWNKEREKLDYETTVIYHVLYIIAKTGMRYGEASDITDDDTKLEDHYLYTHRRYNTATWGDESKK